MIINIIIKLLFISRPIEEIDSVAFPDDTYISLYLAENIASGKGPLYETNYTNGFQPLYVFLCTPFYLFFDSDKTKPLYAALVLLLIFDCFSLIMILKTADLLIQNKYLLIIPGIFWITSPYIILTSMNGLETIISFFFIVSSFYYFLKFRKSINNEENKKHLIILGILCGFAVFSRIDNGFLALIILLFMINDKIRSNKNFKEIFYSILIFSGFVIIIIIPWWIYSFYYTAEIFQSSGDGVRLQNWSLKNYFSFFSPEQLEMVLYGFRIIFIKNISLIFVSGICLIIILTRYKKVNLNELKYKFYELLPLIIFCVLLFFSYVFYIYGMWFFKRYFFPFVFLFILITTVLIDAMIASTEKPKSGLKIIIVLTVIMISVNITRNDFKETYFPNKLSTSGYMKIGEWVSKNFKEGIVIGSMQSGAMSYFADNLKVINLDGVVNEDALKAIKNKSLFDYVRKMKIEFIVGWEINNDYLIRESKSFSKENLTKVLTITGFKTWDREWSVYKVNY